MSDEAAIRRANLRRFRKARNWGPADLHRQCGGSYSLYPSILNDPTKSFGEKIARRLEEGLGLPMGWLDMEQPNAVPAEPVVSEPATEYRAKWPLSDEVLAQLRKLDADALLRVENLVRLHLGLAAVSTKGARRRAA